MIETFEMALKRYKDIVDPIETGVESKTTDAHIRETVPMGIYMHFKSTAEKRMYYAVLGVGRDVDDGVYRVASALSAA